MENEIIGIHAIPSITANATTDGGINSAILRYEGAPIAEPCHHAEDSSKELVTMNEVDLHVSVFQRVSHFPRLIVVYSLASS